jgi:hypothetical protein
MTSYPTTTSFRSPQSQAYAHDATATGPRAKCDQVVFEALCKACEGILASRGERGASGNSNNSTTGTLSSRFNLTQPEHVSVRHILQKWRRALHLPLRLDVYYQHYNADAQKPDNAAAPRELLERWCLVYSQPSSEAWMRYQQQQQQSSSGGKHNSNALSQDPIVQLRAVCKKIVIWLRTLHCRARLLPATAFLHTASQQQSRGGRSAAQPGQAQPPPGHRSIGFSLYAVSEGTEDGLAQQGFSSHPVPPVSASYVVGTPYGVLEWKVWTVDAAVIHRLTGRTNRWALPSTPTTTGSRAIPIQQQQAGRTPPSERRRTSIEEDDEDYYLQQQQQQQEQHYADWRAQPLHRIPQSAPAHMTTQPSWSRQTGSAQQQHPHHTRQASPQQQQQPPSTYHQPSSMWPRQPPAPQHHHHHALLQRRHTSIGQEGIAASEHESHQQHVKSADPPLSGGLARILSHSDMEQQQGTPPRVPAQGMQPQRVLSGLSLAMMTLEDNNNHNQKDDARVPHYGKTSLATGIHEKRRAALHQAPPQATGPPPREASHEYGYAYNNHIPWQKIHPSTTNPSQGDWDVGPRHASLDPDSPGRTTVYSHNLASTPPPMLLQPLAGGTTPTGLKHLLPPRSSSSVSGAPVTPPFSNRPLGFAATTATELPLALPPVPSQTAPPVPSLQARPDIANPLPSLDLLHQSPFSWNPAAHGSMLSSLTMPDSFTLDLRRSLLTVQQQQQHQQHHTHSDYDEAAMDDMPFAMPLETTTASAVGQSAVAGSVSSLAASAAVASLAQKCAGGPRLQFLDAAASSTLPGGGGDPTDDLARQLADLHNFGASLSMNEANTPSASVTTPTALRT